MVYEKIYSQLIEKCKQRREALPLFETHHIVPKCLGGGDDENNLVKMSPREHFIAHKLLAVIHGGSLWFAVIMMSSSKTGRSNNRVYDQERRNFITAQSENKLNLWAIKRGFESYDHQCLVVWEMFSEHKTFKEVGTMFGISPATVSKSIRHYADKNDLLDDYFELVYVVKSKQNSHNRTNTNTEVQRRRKKKIQEVYATGKHDELFRRYSVERVGANNPNAKSVEIGGVIYGSVQEASRETGIAAHKLYRLRKSKAVAQ